MVHFSTLSTYSLRVTLSYLRQILFFSAFVLALCLVVPAKAQAATLYWVGANAAAVSVASNWKTTNPASCGGGNAPAAPTADDDVVFDPDCDNGADIDSELSVNNFTMQAGYTGTVSHIAESIIVHGSWTNAGGVFDPVTNQVFFLGDGTVTSGGSSFFDVHIGEDGSASYSLQDALTVDRDLYIQGVLDTGSDNSINVEGNWNFEGGEFIANEGTVTFTSDNDATISSEPSPFYNVVFAGHSILLSALIVNGDLTITEVFSSEDQSISLSGDWVNNGTYTPGGSEVTLAGGDQSIVGSTNFYNLTKETPGTLTFEKGSTQTIVSILTLSAAGDILYLRSSEDDGDGNPNDQWFIDPQGDRNIFAVDVKDSNNISGTDIQAGGTGSVDSGTNTGWDFVPRMDISGVVYAENRATPLESKVVRILVNGVEEGVTTTAGDGFYELTGIPLNTGDIITVYIDEPEHAVTLTRSHSESATLTNFDLYQNHLILRADNNGAQEYTSANFDIASGNGGIPEISDIYELVGDVTTLGEGKTLYTWSLIDANAEIQAERVEVAGGIQFLDSENRLTVTENLNLGSDPAFHIIGGAVEISGNVEGNGYVTSNLIFTGSATQTVASPNAVHWTIDKSGGDIVVTVPIAFEFASGGFALSFESATTIDLQENVLSFLSDPSYDCIVHITGAGHPTFVSDSAAGRIVAQTDQTLQCGDPEPGTYSLGNLEVGQENGNPVTLGMNTYGAGYTWAFDNVTINEQSIFDSAEETISVSGDWINDDGIFGSVSEASADAQYPTESQNVGGPNANWTNVELAEEGDDTGATVTVPAAEASDTLAVSDFGFSIPVTAIIVGIQVTTTSRTNAYALARADLRKAGVAVGHPHDCFVPDPGFDVCSFSASDDLWETEWTPADINAANFGVELQVVTGDEERVVEVDAVAAAVTYYEAQNVSYSGSLLLNGTNQTMSGSTTFYNLTKTVSSAATLTFQKSKTQTVRNALTLQGAPGQVLSLRSGENDGDSNTNDQWLIDPQGTRSIQHLDVKDSNNINATAILANATVANSGVNTNWTFDSSAPAIQTLSPADNATNVSRTANLVLTFDETTRAGTGTLSIKRTSDNVAVETITLSGAQLSGNGTTQLTLNPAVTLSGSTSYYITWNAFAFHDIAGNYTAAQSSTTAWNFTTVEASAPTVSSFSPLDGAIDVAVDTNLVITFNEIVQGGTGSIVIKKGSDNSIVETISASGALVTGSGSTIMTINPSVTLGNDIAYYVQVGSNGFRDASGNFFAGISNTTTWNFQTVSSSSSSSSSTSSEAGGGGGGGRRGGPGRGDSNETPDEEPSHLSDDDGEGDSGGEDDGSNSGTGSPGAGTFTDVPESSWFFSFVEALAAKGIVSGYEDEQGNSLGLFQPANPVTYAEALKMLLLTAGVPVDENGQAFNTSADDTWAEPFVSVAEHIRLSVIWKTLDVHTPATRGAVFQMLLEIWNLPPRLGYGSYSDLPKDHPYGGAIGTLTLLGIVQGDTNESGELIGTVRPNDPINRAEVAKILVMVLERQSLFADLLAQHEAAGVLYRVNTVGLAVRIEPDVDSEILQKLGGGDAVTVLGFIGEWAHITLPDGREGYVVAKFLRQD